MSTNTENYCTAATAAVNPVTVVAAASAAVAAAANSIATPVVTIRQHII